MTAQKPDHFRPLTTGERVLARRVFGDSVCYDKVGVTARAFMPLQPLGTAMAPDGNLYMYGCYHDDFSTMPPLTQSHFIHEMAHVWQKQNGVLDPIASAFKLSLQFRFNYSAAYLYKLDGARDLTAYNMEQQATIIQDYFLRGICGHGRDTGRCQTGGGWQANKSLYECVLAKFLADPAYARKDKNTGGNSPKPPAA